MQTAAAPSIRHMSSVQTSMSSATTLLSIWLSPNMRLAVISRTNTVVCPLPMSDARAVGPNDISPTPATVTQIPVHASTPRSSPRKSCASIAMKIGYVDATGTTLDTSWMLMAQNSRIR